jgi:hypothetical protein
MGAARLTASNAGTRGARKLSCENAAVDIANAAERNICCNFIGL